MYPLLIHEIGLALASIGITIVAIFQIFSNYYAIEASHYTKASTLNDLIQKVISPKLMVIVSFSLSILSIVNMVSYLLISAVGI